MDLFEAIQKRSSCRNLTAARLDAMDLLTLTMSFNRHAAPSAGGKFAYRSWMSNPMALWELSKAPDASDLESIRGRDPSGDLSRGTSREIYSDRTLRLHPRR